MSPGVAPLGSVHVFGVTRPTYDHQHRQPAFQAEIYSPQGPRLARPPWSERARLRDVLSSFNGSPLPFRIAHTEPEFLSVDQG